ncbi:MULTISPECIES: ABC transporter permease [Paenibacillus]|uniref:Inner-membrane translocator n=2 Tax=Paenibacillus lactis TaxID=228574 RepID=G4HKA4_9BACL|nr:ABC transporter permease [Paenibacillus lactis]EHB62305.1 inner-membrane translocator [Paenibacillus lactis 154]MBP1895656.1 simple sugar transport system permease protein [Paenibacillus lactis]HAG00015.1 ABC transporter permease [Paenibacillus lactis]
MNTAKPLKEKPAASFAFDFLYKYGTLITVAVLILVFGTVADSFLSTSNIINILRSISIVTIIAVGLTVSLSVGGFDLSVGSTATLANALVISMFVWHGQQIGIGIGLTLLICLAVGLINAFLVINFKIDDMLMTLATMFIFQGVAMTYTRGATISQNMIMPSGDFATGKIPTAFEKIGQVPWIIVIMVLVVLIVHLFLTYTKHGRYMYMIGGNREAAALSGIPVSRYRLIAYLVSALFATIGGIILGARVMTAEVNSGGPYLMDAVAAAFIGYSVFGAGKPNALGTFVGAVLIGILQNGLIMLSVPYYAMDIVKGSVLALALALTYYRKRK